jgi:cytochrome c
MKGKSDMILRPALLALLLGLPAAAALADGDPAAGEKVFKKCAACHDVGADAKNKVGPILNGIVDAKAGQVADFGYSSALEKLAAEGLTWDHETLEAYLKKPKDVIPGGKMTFAGLRKKEDLENVIAYLATFQ